MRLTITGCPTSRFSGAVNIFIAFRFLFAADGSHVVTLAAVVVLESVLNLLFILSNRVFPWNVSIMSTFRTFYTSVFIGVI
jgi:hypothetical protein